MVVINKVVSVEALMRITVFPQIVFHKMETFLNKADSKKSYNFIKFKHFFLKHMFKKINQKVVF